MQSMVNRSQKTKVRMSTNISVGAPKVLRTRLKTEQNKPGLPSGTHCVLFQAPRWSLGHSKTEGGQCAERPGPGRKGRLNLLVWVVWTRCRSITKSWRTQRWEQGGRSERHDGTE
jgi:hypothetical protein